MDQLKFSIGDLNYTMVNHASNPFYKRKIAYNTDLLKTSPLQFSIDHLGYSLSFFNGEEAYLKRNLWSKAPRVDTNQPIRIVDVDSLPVNPSFMEFNLNRFLKEAITKLKRDWRQLSALARQIQGLCRDLEIEIPRIEAFEKIDQPSLLLNLLQSLQVGDYRFKLELSMAAILQYEARHPILEKE